MRRHLLITLLIPIFFVSFATGFRPFEILEELNYGTFSPYVHIIFLGCIIMGTLLISRTICFVVEHFTHRLNWWQDIIWCIVEMIVAAFFMALYMSLFSHTLYFLCVANALKYVGALLFQTYAIICLIEALVYNNESTKYSKNPESVVRFYDEHKHLKLVISAPSILFIKADDNTVRINYLESGKIREFVLRASMRSLEPLAAKYHLIRCQRSYYVNPIHVNILRKDNEGFIFAVLDIDGAAQIPVSKTYYDNLASIL